MSEVTLRKAQQCWFPSHLLLPLQGIGQPLQQQDPIWVNRCNNRKHTNIKNFTTMFLWQISDYFAEHLIISSGSHLRDSLSTARFSPTDRPGLAKRAAETENTILPIMVLQEIRCNSSLKLLHKNPTWSNDYTLALNTTGWRSNVYGQPPRPPDSMGDQNLIDFQQYGNEPILPVRLC